jgi:thiol-disulfide isomerase/thioredoxin
MLITDHIQSFGVYPTGELYATQFFSARKLKFILFLRPADVASSSASSGSSAVELWRGISETFRGKALFAYMVGGAVTDVLEYFAVDGAADLPLIVAHDPANDHKFKSKRLGEAAVTDLAVLQEFVAGVVSGAVKRVLKSEPLPKANKGPVVTAVGSNLLSVVGEEGKDVLLEVYAPWCAHCKKLRPTYDILGRAVQAESRIVIAKIDGVANDIPAGWAVKGYPALLWFPAKDKPYKDGGAGPVPRPYWDAGHGLQELLSFVQRESSFDPRSLRVATSEQLGTLLGDEDALRVQYEAEDRWRKRNEGRDTVDNPLLDWVIGEVVFDGKRWHLAAAAALAIVALLSLGYALIVGSSKSSRPVASAASKKMKAK